MLNNWLNPWIFFHFEHWLVAVKFQISYFWWDNGQAVVLNVQFSQTRQFSNLTWKLKEVIIAKSELKNWINYWIYAEFIELTICKFLMFLTSGGKYSKSLSPKYNARRVSTSKTKSKFHFLQKKVAFLTKFKEISRQNMFIQIIVR